MDELDRAQKDILMHTANLIKSAVGHTGHEVEETGFCLYCGEPLKEGMRWCDAECRNAWQKEQDYKRRKYGK